MATLTGQLVAETYKALLKLIDNDILTASEKQISDGLGGGSNVFIDQNGFLRAKRYKVTNGTSSQFLKADGSLDGTAYLPVGTTTTNVPEGTNLYFTTNRVLNTLLTGFVSTEGEVTATDSILTAINKIWWNIENGGGGGGGYVPYTGATQNLNLGTYGLISDFVQFNTTNSAIPTTAGTMAWNSADGTVDLKMGGANVTLQIGQEELVRVVNKTGANLLEANYQAVRVSGAQGNRLKVALAKADNDDNSADTIGLVTETINDNQEGFVTSVGLVRNINTTGTLQSETWLDGDMLYLSATTAGRITNIKPIAPQHGVRIGYVVRAHQTQGQIYVKVDNGYEIDELHNVKITTPQTKDILIYNDVTKLWFNQNIFSAINATDVGKALLAIPNALDTIPVTTKSRWLRINVDNTVSAVEALDTGFIPFFAQAELFLKSPIYTTGVIVGIGTTSPTALLHLKGTTAYTELKLDNNSPTGGGMFIAQQNGNQTALFGADAYYQANTSLDAAVVAKRTGGGIQFYTNGSQSEKMGINADGNVFVGQTPTYTSSATNFIVRGKTGAGHIGVMHYDMSIKGIFNTFNSLVQIGSTTFHSLAFIVDAVERGRINSSGRLLWNTTTDNGVDDVQINGSIIATTLKKSGGTSAQYLMADGSVSTGPSLAGYVPTSRTLTINGISYDLSADRSWTIATSSGTVTSVSATVPTGFAIAGSPITSSGTLAITFASGYSLPTTAKQTEWDSAYTFVSGFPSQTGNSGKFLTTNGSTLSWENVVLGVTSFNTRTGAISLLSGDVTSALGFTPVPTTRSLSINGTAYDLSADRAWTISAGSSARNVSTFTATSGQTTFTISGGYTANLVDVYVNGARLNANDFVATSGTDVVLNVGVVTNDIVEIVNYIASASASISGSGTTGYITKWIGTSVVNNSLIYDNGTNIGIGTITPSAKLHIVGTALVSSSLTANSFVKSGGTSGQILMADGSVITAGTNITISGGTISASGGGGSITGSGTANYLPKWTGSTALGNSAIIDNGVNMVSTASRVLVINQDWGAGGTYLEAFSVVGTFASMCLRNTAANYKWLFHNDGSGFLRWYGGSGWGDSSWTNLMTLDTAGNLFVTKDLKVSGETFSKLGNAVSQNNNSAYGFKTFSRTLDVGAFQWQSFIQFQTKSGFDVNIEAEYRVVHMRIDGDWPQMRMWKGFAGWSGNLGFNSLRWNYQLTGNGNDLGNQAVFADNGLMTFAATPYNVTQRIHIVIEAFCNNWNGVNVLYP
jgi:hypothetical protein